MEILDILKTVGAIVVGLLLLVFLVVIHELGHAIVARRNGVVVEEFGIGFPPRAWGRKLKNGILFSLNWLPLGGFVKLQGENDAANAPGDYGAASLWVKAKILLAGVAINWIAAVIIFTVLAFVGLPKLIDNQFSVASDTAEASHPVIVASVSKDSPAENAGLRAGDKIISLNGQHIVTAQSLTKTLSNQKGKMVTIVYERDGFSDVVQASLNESNDGGRGYLGAGLSQQYATIRATWSAPLVGIMTTVQFTQLTFEGLGTLVSQLFTGQFAAASQSVSGPVGIVGVILPSAVEAGVVQALFLAGIISLTLAVMNTLPIPALDGGRLFVTLIFRVLRKPLTKEREEAIQATGFLLLMGLILLVTVADVGKFF